MTQVSKISLVVLTIVAILAMASLYGLFHGYFDHGQFEIKQFQWSSAKQVAMLAERSDRQALGGLEGRGQGVAQDEYWGMLSRPREGRIFGVLGSSFLLSRVLTG